ncbi:MAG TPA: TetR/AcrR family transcriptional regulator [Microvirga sp.]|nr:TetR/AcrR family transcriptional regulator [Microvirga sp.]
MLIQAAGRLIDEGGPGALTLRAVAALVGISHNAPYRHFADKRALLAAVAEDGFKQLQATIARETASAPNAWAALLALVRAHFTFARTRPALYRLLFSDPELTAATDGAVEREAMATFSRVGALIRKAQAEGVLPSADPLRLTGLFYATLHGLADIELSGRAREAKGFQTVEEIALLQLNLLRAAATAPSGR